MELVLQAEGVAAGGDAIAREPAGRVVFVDGAIPGELVRVAITATKRDYSRARVVEVLEASVDRTEPPCRFVAAGCGGCGWQHIAPTRQRALKQEIVIDALRRIGRLADPVVELAGPLPGTALRTTVRMAIGVDGAPGYRRGASHEVIEPDDCLVTHPRLVELFAARWSGADEVVLRVGARTGERLARSDRGGRALGLPADVRTGDGAHVTELVADVALRVGARSFFQSSPQAAEALAALVGEAVGELPAAAIDAYAGVGLFAATALAGVERLTTIEQSPSSTADARVNLAGRGATIVESSLERWTPTAAEVVVADPARSGLGRSAAAILAGTGCDRFVLVSCDAAAGARDIALLTEHGFTHRRSTVLDPFPHTPHVEIVTLLTR